MGRFRQIPVETTENVEINLSPLIDMVFLLLIFFMVTTVFVRETGVSVRRPRAVTAQDLERRSILLALTEDGQIIYAGRRISMNAVRGLISRLRRGRDLPVIILADEKVDTGLTVRLIDECKLGGAKKVSLAASRNAAP